VNLLRPEVVYADPDTYATVAIVQEPPQMPPGLEPMLRSHRLRVGLYDLVDGRLTRTEQLELDLVGARTELPQLAGRRASDLMLINDDDLTFAKIRLGGRSSATAIAHLGDLDQPMPRALVWGAAWDMTRDAEWSAGDYLSLAISGLPAETDIGVIQKVLLQVRTAIELYATPEHRDEYAQRLAEAVGAAMLDAIPGSDRQLAYARTAISLARTPEQLDLVAGLLGGSRSVPGLVIDTDLRWSLLGRLVASGRAGDAEVDAELAQDNTASGRRSAAAVRSATPTAQAKEQAWTAATTDQSLPNAMLEAAMSGMGIPEQRELYRPFRTRYFEVVRDVWETRSAEMAGMVATALYPGLLVEPETVRITNDFLAANDLPAGLRRIITEGRDGVERSLRCQARDA
jgi:aminopeptidase N